jgi:hypothetical protein
LHAVALSCSISIVSVGLGSFIDSASSSSVYSCTV